MSEPDPHRHSDARLVPQRPPGRGSRKARAFSGEMARLHALGYTLEAIREALAAAGVTVSRSTVQREVARTATRAVPGPAVTQPSVPSAADGAPERADDRRGKDIAETFMRGRITNPLIRARQRTEDPS